MTVIYTAGRSTTRQHRLADPSWDPEVLLKAASVVITGGTLRVRLESGEELAVPIDRFPALQHADAATLVDYELTFDRAGIHWPSLDEDVSVYALLPAEVREAIEHPETRNAVHSNLIYLDDHRARNALDSTLIDAIGQGHQEDEPVAEPNVSNDTQPVAL
jgi:hypothetical protein